VQLGVLTGRWVMVRLECSAMLPAWFGGLSQAARGLAELSLVCAAEHVPTRCERGWRYLILHDSSPSNRSVSAGVAGAGGRCGRRHLRRIHI
jgi:hypothetical protein